MTDSTVTETQEMKQSRASVTGGTLLLKIACLFVERTHKTRSIVVKRRSLRVEKKKKAYSLTWEDEALTSDVGLSVAGT